MSASTHIVVEDRTADKRERIYVVCNNSEMASKVIDALDKHGGIYQQNGKMVEVVPIAGTEKFGTETRVVVRYCIREVDEARLDLLISRACVLLKASSKQGESPTETTIPARLCANLLRHELPFPVLTGIVESPTIRPDGTLVTEHGYDPDTKMYLATDIKVDVPANPTRDDALAAREELLHVVTDYRWAKDSPGESVWLAGLLSVVGRPAYEGNAPMIVADATVRGAGKSGLVKTASIIATGEEPAMQSYPKKGDEEVQKILLAMALSGRPFFVWDNVSGPFGCPSLDLSLTTTRISGRLLAKSRLANGGSVPFTAVQWATGNQMELSADLARRVIIAMIDPMHERPEEREGPEPGKPWEHDDLVGYVKENRARLLGAALTILRAYFVAGCPPQPMRKMDYVGWSRIIRGAIIWIGMRDPAETAAAARASDRTLELHRAVVESWPYQDGHYPRTQDLVEAARQHNRSEWAEVLEEHWPEAKCGDERHHKLGLLLRQIKGSVISGYRIVQPPIPEGGKAPKVPRWARIPARDDVPQYLSAPVLRPEVKSPPSSASDAQGQPAPAAVAAVSTASTAQAVTGAFADPAGGNNIGLFALVKYDTAPADRPARSLLDQIPPALPDNGGK